MRNPDDRSPQEWAEHLRDCVADVDPDVRHIVSYLTAADCDELAARMDDLGEALRLLRQLYLACPGTDTMASNALDSGPFLDRSKALLTKYEEGGDDA